MKALLDVLTPFLVGVGAIGVMVLIVGFCAWFLSEYEEEE